MSEPWPQQPETPRSTTPPDELQHMLNSITPTTLDPTFDNLPLPTPRPARSPPSTFVSSPLNPASPNSTRSRPQSRASFHFNRVVSEEAQALSAISSNSPFPTLGSRSSRGSMLLYRLASDPDPADELQPPRPLARESMLSSSGESIVSLSSDSKYPSAFLSSQRGIVPYAYDPSMDEEDGPDDEDMWHDPTDEKNGGSERKVGGLPLRGIANCGILMLLIGGLLCLFVFYPVLVFLRDRARNLAIDGNIRINGTGQAAVLANLPHLIDPETPTSAKTRTGFDGEDYTLVFSDEFNTDGRTFYPGDDPYWEAVDLWYWATGDYEWYDPGQVTTSNGSLVILLEQTDSHQLNFRSGMLQSWNKFCFSSGYIEVSVVLPGPNSNTQGYWPGVWTMGNLGRPGYGATTDGTWPYSYDSCDVGTFPNQTLKDGSGPPASVYSSASKSKYNYALSWLDGQKLSACTCPGEEHPGPSTSVGRGAPEIDVLEVELNKLTGTGQVVSQSAQFAPFTQDYKYGNSTNAEFEIYDSSITWPNTYKGSAVQQAVSALTMLPDSMMEGSGAQFTTLGFEYWASPSNPEDAFITWQVDGNPSARLGAPAMGPDQGTGGTGVSQRLVSQEPMSIVFNLGISPNWQTVDYESMSFPSHMMIDYVRVYQRKGQENIGCNPKDFPTEDYINSHLEAYTNPNWTSWRDLDYSWPKNSQYDGC